MRYENIVARKRGKDIKDHDQLDWSSHISSDIFVGGVCHDNHLMLDRVLHHAFSFED